MKRNNAAGTPGPLDVKNRLLELASLDKGWGEYGDELPPNEERIDRLIRLYDDFGSTLHNPYIFPTVDGNLQMEWKSADILEMELDLQTLSGTLYSGDEEIRVDLNDSKGWSRLISAVNGRAVRRCATCSDGNEKIDPIGGA